MNAMTTRVLTAAVTAGVMALGQCSGKDDVKPTPTPTESTMCDSIVSEQLTWCVQPAPSAEVSGK